MNTKCLLPLAFFTLFISNVFAQELQIDSIAYQAELCEGNCESAQVYVSGGESPYQFAWSNGLEVLNGYFEYCSAGTYVVTVTDAMNNVAVDSFEVVVHELLLLAISPTGNVDCDGLQDVEFLVKDNGTLPYEYSCNGGEFSMEAICYDLPIGTHTLTIREGNGCTTTIEFTLNGSSFPLEVEITATGNTATATPSGGTPPYSYQWNDPNMQTTATAVGLEEGIYSVTVTGANGCEATAEIDLTVGVEMPEHLTNFDIFPNPSNEKFTIDLQFEVTQRATIQVLNTLGQEMYHFTDTQSHFLQTIDMHKALAGTYFVVISTEGGRVVRRVVLM